MAPVPASLDTLVEAARGSSLSRPPTRRPASPRIRAASVSREAVGAIPGEELRRTIATEEETLSSRNSTGRDRIRHGRARRPGSGSTDARPGRGERDVTTVEYDHAELAALAYLESRHMTPAGGEKSETSLKVAAWPRKTFPTGSPLASDTVFHTRSPG